MLKIKKHVILNQSLETVFSAYTFSDFSDLSVVKTIWAVTVGQRVCSHQPMTVRGCEDYKNVVISTNLCPLLAPSHLFTHLCCSHIGFPQQIWETYNSADAA